MTGWKVGIDGCKSGWFYLAFNGAETKLGIVGKIEDLFTALDQITQVFIDIPIGLNDSGAEERACDKLARKILKPRGSTVFPAPVRPCLNAETYTMACRISETLTGKKISQQAFHIFRKIREVDELLQKQPQLRSVIHEVHPELGFCVLNSGKPLLSPKKTAQGIEDRLSLLEEFIPNARELYANALAQYRRKELARDDIVDAMMGLCIACAPRDALETLPNPAPKDAFGIEMAMHFCVFSRRS
ncbi:DUF429 domain-containing protein [Pseudidiomarina salilacus]|uniref:DUF429 domain-containing protein n=1 Tax=Pseudidiomarina salilacus TaxID=3384452 RepID=UPI003984CD2D